MSYLSEAMLRIAAMQQEIDTDSDAKGFAVWRLAAVLPFTRTLVGALLIEHIHAAIPRSESFVRNSASRM